MIGAVAVAWPARAGGPGGADTEEEGWEGGGKSRLLLISGTTTGPDTDLGTITGYDTWPLFPVEAEVALLLLLMLLWLPLAPPSPPEGARELAATRSASVPVSRSTCPCPWPWPKSAGHPSERPSSPSDTLPLPPLRTSASEAGAGAVDTMLRSSKGRSAGEAAAGFAAAPDDAKSDSPGPRCCCCSAGCFGGASKTRLRDSSSEMARQRGSFSALYRCGCCLKFWCLGIVSSSSEEKRA
mmetsp:Transcript_11086/g.28027  ORF Transcript_11086/g.28027 Transcript_11086/m.28027 type:complete len:240 (+) Transcript_11086:807-1526(+)